MNRRNVLGLMVGGVVAAVAAPAVAFVPASVSAPVVTYPVHEYGLMFEVTETLLTEADPPRIAAMADADPRWIAAMERCAFSSRDVVDHGAFGVADR